MINRNQKLKVTAAHIEHRLNGGLSETCALGWLPPSHDCKTGCWTFDPKTGDHSINLSEVVDEQGVSGLTTAQKTQYACATLRHEHAHAKRTERNFKAMNDACRKAGVPFTLLNMFEDARIEHAARLETGKKFNWLKWETTTKQAVDASGNPTPCSPADVFLDLVKIEPRLTRNRRWKTKGAVSAITSNTHPKAGLIMNYYEEACLTRETLDLLPLLHSWMMEFPETANYGGVEGTTNHAGGGNDMKAASEAAGVKMPDWNTSNRKPTPTSGSGTVKIGGGNQGGFTHAPGFTVVAISDKERAKAKVIALRLSRKLRMRGNATVPRLDSAKRLNMKGIIRGGGFHERPFVGKVEAQRGSPRIALIVDGSGSMSGEPSNNARVFCLALNMLCKSGDIEAVDVWFSTMDKFTGTTMPCDDRWFAVMSAQSGDDGLGRTTLANIAKIAKSRVCLFFTDAQLGSALAPHRATIRSKGVTTLGLYAGSRVKRPQEAQMIRESMVYHFDKNLIRASLDNLIEEIVIKS